MLFNQKALVSFLSPLEDSVYIDSNWDVLNTNSNKIQISITFSQMNILYNQSRRSFWEAEGLSHQLTSKATRVLIALHCQKTNQQPSVWLK